MIKSLLPLLLIVPLLACGVSTAQDNTNPYCGPGNVPTTGTDGPASLPQRCMFTQISSTPSSHLPKYVGPTDSLPMALSAAVPGDLILVDPASDSQIVGKFLLPNGDCASQKWITIKTASPFIPDEYTEVNPSFAAQMPKITLTAQNATITGGSCVRLIGFEVRRKTTGILYNMIGGLGHDVILDRLYIHGTASDETVRGVELSNSVNVAVLNSYLADFHCLAAAGSCTDAQAIHGGTSSTPDGNYKIVNNYLEAGTENILFGGGAASQPPSDITVAYNTLAKPMSWNPKDPSYLPVTGKDGNGHPWVVKNLFELKNGARVLFEGNTAQYTWGGFTQVGAMILLTPKNQSSATGSVCPLCAVTDVTIRYNHASYGGQALQLACITSGTGGWPAGCANWSVHDNLFDHMQYANCYLCSSFMNEIAGGNPPSLIFSNVTVAHNSFVLDVPGTYLTAPNDPAATQATAAIELGAPVSGNAGMHWDFNTFESGNNGIYSTGGGKTNCFSNAWQIQTLIANCWPSGSFTGNAITMPTGFSKARLPWPDQGDTSTAGPNQPAIDAAVAHKH